jgi:peptidoglycan/xylan/chitin deacetylase (PgdA/CDA1 family)
MKGFQWPEGKKLAVAPLVAWELWPDNLGSSSSHQETSQRPLPRGVKYDRDMRDVYEHAYAERGGLRRLLDLFEAYEVRVTFAASGKRVEVNPDLARDVLCRGHELASESYVHEYPVMYTREEEREELRKTVEAFERVLGVRPSGYVSPGHRQTPSTLPLLFELGYEWHADFQGDDVPFLIRNGDQVIVAMPCAHVSDYETYPRSVRSPREVLQMLRDELFVALREAERGEPRIFAYMIHPFLCRGFRTAILEDLFEALKRLPQVWITTRKDIADWVREHPGNLPERSLEEVLADFPEQ